MRHKEVTQLKSCKRKHDWRLNAPRVKAAFPQTTQEEPLHSAKGLLPFLHLQLCQAQAKQGQTAELALEPLALLPLAPFSASAQRTLWGPARRGSGVDQIKESTGVFDIAPQRDAH